MALKLNNISDPKVAEEEIRRYNAYLETKLKAVPGSSGRERERYFFHLGNLYMWLGLYSYMLEEEAARIVGHFSRSADAYRAMFEARQPPGEREGSREMRKFEQALAMAVCFGSVDVRAALGHLPEWAYRFPVRPEQEAYACYLAALKAVVSSGSIDQNLVAKALAASEMSGGPANVPVLEQASALLALSKADGGEFNRHLAAVVRIHESDAEVGELTDSPEGFICFEAMALAGLARRVRIEVVIASPYLPHHLIV